MTTFRKFFQPGWRKLLSFSIIGATGGYAYYYFIGCASGTCPLSSNPYISTAYGVVVGALMTVGGPTRKDR